MKQEQKLRLSPAAAMALATGDIGNFLVATTPGGIEMQEAAGQRALVASAVLPVKGPWPILTSMGIKNLSAVQGDDLFCNVELPPGWQKRATDHSMWSELVDDKGRKRASIFYKAAFYDRDAFMHVTHFIDLETVYYQPDGETPHDWDTSGGPACSRIEVRDKAGVVHQRSELIQSRDYEATDAASVAMKAWADEHFPDRGNPLAYWDE